MVPKLVLTHGCLWIFSWVWIISILFFTWFFLPFQSLVLKHTINSFFYIYILTFFFSLWCLIVEITREKNRKNFRWKRIHFPSSPIVLWCHLPSYLHMGVGSMIPPHLWSIILRQWWHDLEVLEWIDNCNKLLQPTLYSNLKSISLEKNVIIVAWSVTLMGLSYTIKILES